MGAAPLAARFVTGPLEPGIAAVALAAEAAAVDWDDYQKCSQVCQAAIGEACFAMNGRVVGGQPDGVRVPLPRAHSSRRKRAGR